MLKYAEPLTTFAFHVNLRRYKEVGYTLHDRVIRAAEVGVYQSPA
jgi:hypothetical protein